MIQQHGLYLQDHSMEAYNQIQQSIKNKDIHDSQPMQEQDTGKISEKHISISQDINEQKQISYSVVQNIVRQYLTQLPNIQYTENEIINLLFQDISLQQLDAEHLQNQIIYAINSIVNYLSLKHAADVITNKVQALALGEERHEGEYEILDLQDFEALNIQKEIEEIMKEQLNIQIETQNLQNKLKLLQQSE